MVNTSGGPVDLDDHHGNKDDTTQTSDWKTLADEATKNGYESRSPQRREPRAVVKASAATEAAEEAAPAAAAAEDTIEEDFQASDWRSKCEEATKDGYLSTSPRRTSPKATAADGAAEEAAAEGIDMIEEDFQASDWRSKCEEATKDGYLAKSPRRPKPSAAADGAAEEAAAEGMDMIEEDFQASDWKKKCEEATKDGYLSTSPRRTSPKATAADGAAEEAAAGGIDMIEEDFQASDWKKKCEEATKDGYLAKSPRSPKSGANGSAADGAAEEAGAPAECDPMDWRTKADVATKNGYCSPRHSPK